MSMEFDELAKQRENGADEINSKSDFYFWKLLM